ncbi:acyltransferase family protein [Henriciella litoralis]|uniref:acyltransferase family protein n=1 Tax=Henriciella litoralis TaxID=568102 RepID=UPI00146A34C2|nr:acyltransferase [Henriciella litoralis]
MKLDSIQSLRAAAAMLVVVYHTRSLEIRTIAENGFQENPLAGLIVQNGFAGVDLFFVISGFIMVYVTGKVLPRPMTSLAFLFARAARIYPLWWLFAALMMAYFFFTLGTPWDAGVKRSLDGTSFVADNPWLHIVLSLGLLPQPAWPVFGLGWTLVHEMHFYLVFALIILLPRRFLPWVLLLWAALVIAGALAGLTGPYPTDYLSLAVHPLSLEFIGGCLAGLLVMSGRRFHPPLMVLLSACALVGALIAQGQETPFTLEWGRVFWFGLPSIALVYALASLEANGGIEMPRWLVTLGDWSFALYLSHLFVLSGVRRLFPVIGQRLDGTPYADWFILGSPGLVDNILYNVTCVSLSLLFAALVFYLFERPVIGLSSRARRALFKDTNAQLKPAPIKPAIW